MLQMSEQLSEAGLVVPRPARTTFPDGRMATKEAWNYCKALCKEKKLKAPTLRTFKWHLKHGNLIKAGQVPNPFGGAGPAKVYAITCEAVAAFVNELEKDPNQIEMVEQGPATKPAEKPRPPEKTPEPETEERWLLSAEAFRYLQRNVKGRFTLDAATFGHYLVYDIIPSRLVERGGSKKDREVEVGDLDAFLELAPDGNYANQLDYKVAPNRGPDELSLKDAYDYYAGVDPDPISLTTFRGVVAAGIIPAIRTTNSPRAPIVGFRRQDVNAFLAMRQRLYLETHRVAEKQRQKDEAKKESAARSTLVAKTIQEALDRAKPELEKAERAAKTRVVVTPPKAVPKPKPVPQPKTSPKSKPVQPATSEVPKERWVPTRDAYAYYEERAPRPFTDSWFRDKVYRGDLFKTKVEEDKRPGNPSGKKYFVDLNSIDAYLAQDPKTKPKPQKAWPVEKAYHKFGHLIPAGLSLLQFKRLVNTGLIRSFTRNSVVHVRLDAVEAYFDGLAEVDDDTELQIGPAYDYYCSRCGDPVAKAHFQRWVASGEIGESEKNDEGLWTITTGDIDAFLDRYPSGRMRTNKNSRVVSEARSVRKKSKPKEGPSKAAPPLPEVPAEAQAPVDPPTAGSKGTVSISMSDYSSPVEMAKALELLTSQGFEVSVKP